MSWNRGLSGDQRFNPRPCPCCKRMMSKSFLLKRNKQRSKNIKSALAISESVGRPRKADYAKILELRKKGLSIQKIADTMSCSERTVSRGAIQHCLRLNKPAEQEG